MTEKDKKIIENAEKLGIPIFVLVAKDACSTETIRAYKRMCINKKCKKKHTDALSDRIFEFYEWQKNNPDQVKLPD